jgi:Protein of unknown function (DUF3467)
MESEFLHARYANLFRIGYNEHEMILDFGQSDPDGEAEAMHTRIITAVAHGKVLLEILAEAVSNHEESIGPPPVSGKPS